MCQINLSSSKIIYGISVDKKRFIILGVPDMKVSLPQWPIIIFALLLSIVFPPVNAKQLNTSQAINQAGLQRMLSQRMAKNYILLSQNIDANAAADELDESAALFEENLFNLTSSIKDKKSKTALQRLKREWYGFRVFALENAKTENTERVVKKSTSLLKTAHALVLSIEFTSRSHSDHLVNLSGRQRMLSQRLAMLYYASNSGYTEKLFQQEMHKTARQFDQALTKLIKSRENTPEIKESLQDIANQWSFYKTRFDGSDKGRFSPKTIKVVSESLLKAMNDITKLYEIVSTSENKYASWIKPANK